MNVNDARRLVQKRLANIREYDSVLVLNGVICLGLSLAMLHGEPASGLVFGAIAMLSFAARHRLRRFGRLLAADMAGLGASDTMHDRDAALFVRARTSFWRIVFTR